MSRPADHIEVIARGLWVEGGSVLLCRSVQKGYLYLPGGHVDPGEAASEALAREFVEETGERVRVGGLAAVAEARFSTGKRSHHEVNLVFLVEHWSGSGSDGIPHRVESKEPDIAFEWVKLEELGDRDVRPAALKGWLAGQVEHPSRAAETAPASAAGVVWLSSAE